MGEPNGREAVIERGNRFSLALCLAIICGLTAGLGVVFHDGRPWAEGLCVGLGLGLLMFVIVYVRVFRAIAEMLSLIR